LVTKLKEWIFGSEADGRIAVVAASLRRGVRRVGLSTPRDESVRLADTAHPPRRAGSAVATTNHCSLGNQGRGGGVGRGLAVGSDLGVGVGLGVEVGVGVGVDVGVAVGVDVGVAVAVAVAVAVGVAVAVAVAVAVGLAVGVGVGVPPPDGNTRT
jgi:hypothetical protein